MKDDCELISRSKVDKLEKELKEANEEICYWINAYQEEVRKGGRNE